jgi:uncharacterized protein YbjT (DUF2867 family)
MNIGNDLILVSGATGQQGGAVARQLLGYGHRVRVMTRRPESESAKALAGLGATVVQADFDDPRSLERALSGAWGAFAVQNTWEAGVEAEEEQGKRFAECARRAGVQHYVYSSVGSAHRNTGIPHFDNKWRIEQTVNGLGFPSSTILRPVFFMENWVSPWFKPALDNGQVAIGIKPDTRLQMIAVADIGIFGRLAFERHLELNGEAIDIAGDERTGPEAAEIFATVMGRAFSFFQVPIEDVRQASEDFALMLEWFDRVGYEASVPALEKRFAVKMTTLRDWAERTLRS